MRIAIFGAGGVGGYFGGRLAEAGESVAFIARGEHLEALRRNGLTVESLAGDFSVRPVEATGDPSAVGPVDAVIVGVKAWQVEEAARAMGPLLGGDTFVVPLQNGVVAASEIGGIIGPERVLGGLCRLVSLIAAPGRIRHAGLDPRIEFGELHGRSSPRVEILRSIFSRARGVSVVTPPDINVALWEKFVFIAAVSGVGAVTRMPIGVIRAVPETRRLVEEAMREVFTVGRAMGAALPDDTVERTLRFVDSAPAGATASMQRDIMEGRPSELAYQNGSVVHLAARCGLAVPVNAFLYAALLPSERKARGERDVSNL